jgi:hypothetical protein
MRILLNNAWIFLSPARYYNDNDLMTSLLFELERIAPRIIFHVQDVLDQMLFQTQTNKSNTFWWMNNETCIQGAGPSVGIVMWKESV